MMQHSQKFLRHRKFMAVLPLLALPFLTMIFWALGGGKDPSKENIKIERLLGLNLNLPGAYFKEEKFDKLSLYQKVKNDSIKILQQRRNDPYFELAPVSTSFLEEGSQADAFPQPVLKKSESPKPLPYNNNTLDPNEELVNQKLEQLQKVIHNTSEEPILNGKISGSKVPESHMASDVERLEQMMHIMGSPPNEEDPELVQLQAMIDRILDIQHPERVRQKIKEQSLQEKKRAFPVHSIEEENEVSLIEPAFPPAHNMVDKRPEDSLINLAQDFTHRLSANGFYGMDEETGMLQGFSNAIEAVVHETQELANGSVIKLRLLNDVYVNGSLVPKGHFIYGKCQLNMERLLIGIPTIQYDQSLFPVALSAYDLDGLEGIYIPGAISRDVAKQASDQAVQGFNLYSFDPSIAAQATTAGINAAKGLLSRKAKLIKVTVKAGYRLILTDGIS